jgi:glycosyltransferase involved in cell wall biosynthesis
VIPAAFAIPGDIDLPTGGYGYDRRMLALLPHHGIAIEHLPLPGGFPDPSAAELGAARARLTAVAGKVVLIDGLAFGAMPATLIAAITAPLIALVHHPLYLEEGLAAARRSELHGLEQAALALARHVLVTSPATAQTLRQCLQVPAGKITVAEPGTDPAQRAPGSGGEEVQLLTVGAVVPRKAHALLVAALAPLVAERWHLTIVGPTNRSAAALSALTQAIDAGGLDGRVSLVGAVAGHRLGAYYARADAFVLPSLYEGYGMALAEAMACGLPILCTTGGAAAETVPEGAALKVPPGDAAALTTDLRRLLTEAGLRRRLADAAFAAGQRLPRWEDGARTIAALITTIAASAGIGRQGGKQ